MKRKESVHNEEPDTKRIIIDDLSEDVDERMADVGAIAAKQEDEWIVCRAILGKDLHDVYSNARTQLAINRQSAEYLMQITASMIPSQRGTKPGEEEPSGEAAPQRGTRPGGVLGAAGLGDTDVVEVFSPERVGQACGKFGLIQGTAMDIKSGYDFDLEIDRARFWKNIKEEKPMLVIGSPPCTLFSKLQELNKFMYRDSKAWMEKFQERMLQAKRYVSFCLKIYEYQRSEGRYFLHEHPWLATSWQL